ncbi:serine/threonine-protein kinase [Streptomyces celluloflavus]|uniref:serine/threonine-protein kinase n=1 Tax=Streptomyces celluloflavus TaxID=58344 RepID=UPI00369CA2B8
MGEIFAGRYELIDPIGRGGVGAVWRAWDQRRRRYVAAKVLQQSDAHTLLRFVREQALRIDHPHVLAPASWAADDDKVLFTMDLVNGGSLAHLTGDYGPLPPRYVCTLLDQLLAGLTAVHAEGVVHRDIKPANILLEATGTGRPHLRLSDFGIAMRKGEPRLTEANYVVGTPGYFAPEQMLGAEPDFPADLFAVGLVGLYLVTGRKPDSEALIRHFARHGIPDAPEDVPEPLWQVLATLLHPDPQARFRTATGARKALLPAVEMLPETTIEDEVVEVFDHIGPLPSGYGADGPLGPGTKADGPSGNERPVPSGNGSLGPHGNGSLGPHGSGGPRSYRDDDVRGDGIVAAHGDGAARRDGAARGDVGALGDVGSPAGPAHQATGTAAGQVSMSDTGSFQLAPPRQSVPAPPQPAAPPTPTATPAPTPTPLPGATPPGQGIPPAPATPPPPPPAYEPTAGLRPEPSATRPYTADHHPVPGHPPATAPGQPAPMPPMAQMTGMTGIPGAPGTAGMAGMSPMAQPTYPAYPASMTATTSDAAAAVPAPPGPAPYKRPGPPQKVAVPVLIVALLCIAVGVWALLAA